jgi:hypothetical protein
MNGGEISGNTAKGDGYGNGGGVYVGGGTFEMNGGEISGNTAKGDGNGGYGGGVYVTRSGELRKTSGRIYGINAASNLRNTADTYAAWYSPTPNRTVYRHNGSTWDLLPDCDISIWMEGVMGYLGDFTL